MITIRSTKEYVAPSDEQFCNADLNGCISKKVKVRSTNPSAEIDMLCKIIEKERPDEVRIANESTKVDLSILNRILDMGYDLAYIFNESELFNVLQFVNASK